jgi:ADP-heptose:LPS heptosyltransferase
VESAAGIVVVRGGALGDVLLGVPALRALRRHFRGQRLHLVAPQPQAALVVAGGAADSATGLDDTALVPLFLEGRPLDRVPRPLHAPGLAVVWLHGANVIAGNLARLGAGRVLSSRALPDPEGDVHAADWLLSTLAPLGVPADSGWDAAPWLSLPDGAREWADRWQAGMAGEGPFLALHPGSGAARKNWPGASWARAVRAYQARTRLTLVLVAGPADDRPLAAFQDAAAALAWQPARPDVVLRTPDLSQLGAVLARAAVYFGNDSGVTHLAAAVGAPTVAVFGASDPKLWRPRGPRVRVLGAPGAWPEPDAVLAAATALAGGRA